MEKTGKKRWDSCYSVTTTPSQACVCTFTEDIRRQENSLSLIFFVLEIGGGANVDQVSGDFSDQPNEEVVDFNEQETALIAAVRSARVGAVHIACGCTTALTAALIVGT